jgi:uncharacterized protein with NAD-binding domain and iron-sulfur cluster
MSQKKIAILGGGVCSLVAAFELTSAPDWQDYYDITIYQMGWRLGGKAASGRNRQLGDRIEEHGFHFWWSFYENAFHMIQQVYKELNRPPEVQLATWEEAFRPIEHSENMVFFNGRWQLVPSNYTKNPGTPGTNLDRALPTPAEYICLFLDQMIGQIKQTKFSNMAVEPPTSLKLLTRSPWWNQLRKKIGTEFEGAAINIGIGLLHLARALACWQDDVDFDLGDKIRFEAVDLLLKVFIEALWLLSQDEIGTNLETYVTFVETDYAIAIMRGMINDGLLENSFNTINDKDFRQWLGDNGAEQVTLDSYVVSGTYDMAFCYEDGDLLKPNVEAGSTLRIVLRMLLTYQGYFFYYMDAAMSEAVIAPIYLLLKRRGVNFKFFHRVENLHIGPDGRTIESVVIARQATPINGDYNPLYDVKGLPSWPNEPFYEQLVEGKTLSERIEVAGVEIPKYNLESFWTPWQGVEKITLTHQQDYDLLILGIPLGSLPYICQELLAVEGKVGDRWRNMVKYVKTNQTQALQLWLSDTFAELGWPFQGIGRPLVGEFDTKPEYVDTWADMSQVIKRENWPAGFEPQDIAYFIGVLKDDFGPTLPPASDHNFPHQQFQRTKENSLGFLRENIQDLWPEATKPDGPYPHALDWQILIDENEGQQGEQRLNSQFWRANIDPSERYVLSVAGSTQYRLKTDESGYDNLFLTGDWIYNGANVGFVDGAVTSGMRTSQAITKLLIGQTYPQKIFGWEDY